MTDLVLGPILRYVGTDQATVWVETDAPCDVELLGHSERTFTVEGQHYALVCVDGLAPAQAHTYDTRLDGRRVWLPPGYDFQALAIRTIGRNVLDLGRSERGRPPASIVLLAGDVHHAYLAEVGFRRDAGVRSAVYQAGCSPFRNALDAHEQQTIRFA
jgi:hypothetical protein